MSCINSEERLLTSTEADGFDRNLIDKKFVKYCVFPCLLLRTRFNCLKLTVNGTKFVINTERLADYKEQNPTEELTIDKVLDLLL